MLQYELLFYSKNPDTNVSHLITLQKFVACAGKINFLIISAVKRFENKFVANMKNVK